jgi:D-alanine-D-alanine ligase-like ATP-grasp enzyme
VDDEKEFVMNTDEFIERLGDKSITWQNTFYPQIKDITKKVFNKMSEVMEHRANCFELYGLDFVIDQRHKCWLIEANMSPACAHRKG